MSTFRAKLHELWRRKAALKAEALELLAKETDLPEGEQPDAAEGERLAVIKAEMENLEAKIRRVESAIELEAETTAPIGDPDDPEPPGHQVATQPYGYGEVQIPEEKGFNLARFAIGLWHAKGGMGLAGAAAFVERRFGAQGKIVAKALNTSGAATGGALIPQAFSAEFIELLRATTVTRTLKPVTVPMPLGNLTIPRLSAGASASYQGELDDITSSQETVDDLQLNAKKLTALVPVSNDLIRRSAIGVEGFVRDDLLQTCSRREDLAFITGDGSGGSPIGFINLAPSTNKLTVAPFTATDNATILTAVVSVLQGMRMVLRMNMSRMIRPAWIAPPTVEAFLLQLRDGVGNFVYKDELQAGKLMGYPFATTQQLATNINTGTTLAPVNNGAFLFLTDFADVIIGETYNMAIDASDVASYKDTTGSVVSTFVRDQTVFRVIEEHDFNMRHLASIAVAILPGWAPDGYTGTSGTAYYVQAASGDGSAAPSTWGTPPTGSNNPANIATVAPGGTLPGRS